MGVLFFNDWNEEDEEVGAVEINESGSELVLIN